MSECQILMLSTGTRKKNGIWLINKSALNRKEASHIHTCARRQQGILCEHFVKKIIFALLLCLLIPLVLGLTAYAEEATATELEPSDSEVVVSIDCTGHASNSEQASEELAEQISEEAPDGTGIAEPASEEEPSASTIQAGDISGSVSETVEEPATEEATAVSEGQGTAEPSTSDISYVVTISDGSASVDLTGGTSNRLSDILCCLGYDIADAEITFDPDSLDTDVLSITEDENGFVLDDFGPFSKAKRNLIVYLNGNAVELSIVDPVTVSGEMMASELEASFFADQNGNIKLTGDVTITDSSLTAISISSGNHDLYLNGHFLYLRNSYLSIASGAVLNIYGGQDRTSDGNGKIFGGICPSVQTAGGELNVFSGTIRAEDEQGTSVLAQSGIVNLYGGTIGSSNTEGTAFLVNGDCTVLIHGGYVKGANAISFGSNHPSSSVGARIFGGTIIGSFPAGAEHCVEVAGGRYVKDPTPFLFNGNDDGKWQVAVSEYDDLFTVVPSGNGADYGCVFYSYNSQPMTGCSTLAGAISSFPDNSTVVLLKDQSSLSIIDEKTLTLDLNGKVLRAEQTPSGSCSVIVLRNSCLTLTDSFPEEIHGEAGLPAGGLLTGGEASVQYNGGGVHVSENSRLIMNSGTITANNAIGFGGGVYVDSSASFIMNGGLIAGNSSSSNGGGVAVMENATFTMNAGTIFGNSAHSYGGGVIIYGAFNMNGGSISGNHAGVVGGGVLNFGTMEASGKADITENTLSADSVSSNLCIINGNPVSLQDGFSGRIGVTVLVSDADFRSTSGLVAVVASQRPLGELGPFFSTDDESYPLIYSAMNTIAVGTPVAEVVTDTARFPFDTVENAVNAFGDGTQDCHAAVTVRMTGWSTESIAIGPYQDVVLDLHGNVLSAPENFNRSLTVSGSLVIHDSSSKRAHPGTKLPAGGVITGGGISNTGIVEMNGGTIFGCSSENGGGIFNRGTIRISDSVITENSATLAGGGIFNDYGATCELKSVTISKNFSGKGGGVYNNGVLQLIGCSVSSNKAYNNAGGVFNCGTASMQGGGITSNIVQNLYISGSGITNCADFILIDVLVTFNTYDYDPWEGDDSICPVAAVYNEKDATLTLGGSTRIVQNNCYDVVLAERRSIVISVAHPPVEGMSVGVEIYRGKKFRTGAITQYNSNTEPYAGYFFSQIPGYSVRADRAGHNIRLSLFGDIDTNSYPSAPSGKISVTGAEQIVSMDSLSAAIQSAINRLLQAEGCSLITIINTENLWETIGGASVGPYTLEISKNIFNGFAAESLKVWFMNDDNTLTAVPFDVNNGNIVIPNGKAGLYVLTAE